MIKSITTLWVASLAGAAAAFFTQVIIARSLGPDNFGQFAAALTAVTLLAPLASFGLGNFWLKVFGQEGWSALRWVRPSIILVSLSTLCALSLAASWAVFGPHDVSTTHLFLLISPYIIGHVAVQLLIATYQLEERYSLVASWQVLPHLLRLLAVAAIVSFYVGPIPPIYLAGLFAFTGLTIAFLSISRIRRFSAGFVKLAGHVTANPSLKPLRLQRPSLFTLAAAAWPFGAVGALHLVYFQSDIVILKYLTDNASTGFYNVAFLITAAVYLLPSAVYQKYFMPKLHRWATTDMATLRRVYEGGNRVMAALGFGACILILVLAPWIIGTLFGDEYRPALGPLVILSFAIPLRFISTSIGAVLTTNNNVRRKVRYMGATALVNVSANFLLIPIYGMNGAALATLLSEFALLTVYRWAAENYGFRPATSEIKSQTDATL